MVFEKFINVILNTYKFRFVDFELPPGLHEVTDLKSIATDLVKINILTDDKTMKASFITINDLRFDEQ